MNYWQRNTGDYARDTGLLSITEHGAYTLLLDYAYATESPIPTDFASACRICRAVTQKEREAVRRVTELFFPGGINKRVAAELAAARDLADKSSHSRKVSKHKKRLGQPLRVSAPNPCGSGAGLVASPAQSQPAISDRHQTPDSKTPEEEEGGVGDGSGWVPSDTEIFAFGAAFPGEPASGAPGPIPADYVAEQIKAWHGRRDFPPRWKALLRAAWRADFPRYMQQGAGGWKKNAPPVPAWKEAKLIAVAIDQHPANPDGCNFAGYKAIAEAARNEFAAMRVRLDELGRQEMAKNG